MNKHLRRLLAAVLAAMLLGMETGVSEMTPIYGKAKDEAWYQQVLARAQMSLGNNARLKRVIERAGAGEEITLAVIGGSITEGAGAGRYKECWAVRVAERFGSVYGVDGGKNVKLVNAGVGGTASTYGLMRYQRDVVERVTDPDGLPDVVIIEYSVNDWGEPTGHRCFEALVRTALSQPNEPAVILLFAVFKNGWNLQDELKKIGKTYDLMMVSIRDGAFPEVGNHWTAKEFFYDEYHPTSLGHVIMADCILSAIDAANRAETSAADVDPGALPAYGADYVGLKTIYAGRETEGVAVSRGGFAQDDKTSYANTPVGRVCGENFFHNTGDGNEPLRVEASFKKLLVAWRAMSGKDYGRAEVLVDGKVRATLEGGDGKWGQSEVILAFDARESAAHTVEIRMAEGSENKKFTITCLAIVP